MRRLLCLALVGVAAIFVASAGAAPPSPANPAGRALGIVTPFSSHTAGSSKGAGNLKYHGGPVEHVNTVYAIYWVPSGFSIQSGYDTVINQFFKDVATASNSTSNVYATDTQYYDSVNGNITYNSSFAGSALDTNALPASGCSDSDTPAACLTDGQIQAEIQRVAAANGWSPSPTTEFFMFTAKGVGSCLSSSQCAFTYYCAYHSSFGSGSSTYLYANMPYADTVPSACDAGQHPNNNDADATINVTSHEHNETITDPLGNAWYDSAGYENGDKCAWIFGSSTGSTAYGQYNQTIAGDHYYLQEEYSNQSRSCVQHM